MISGARYQSETMVLDFRRCMNEAFFARPKSANLIFPIEFVMLIAGLLTILVHQDVVRLDVSVKYHLPMHDIHGSEHLPHHGLDPLKGDRLRLFHEELAQRRAAVLEYAVDDLVLVGLILDDIEDLHKVGLVAKALKDRDLPHG